MAGNRRRVLLTVVVVAGLLAAGAGIGLALSVGRSEPPAPPATSALQRELARQTRTVAGAFTRVALSYPSSAGQPAPSWSPAAFDSPLPRHVVLGFVPYYSLNQLTPADYRDVTTVAYDGVSLTPSGAVDKRSTDLGWSDLSSPEFSTLVASAHAAKDRVLLTVFTASTTVIDAVTRHPQTGAVLARQLAPLLADNRLDGVDVDVEGSGQADRAGFVRFVRTFVGTLHSTDPSASIVLDTYPGSAGDAQSFFDVAALAPLVDTMFVMAYDMYQPGRASPNAPLASPTLGESDVQTLLQYTEVVKASELVLGVPFYGYDFTTTSNAMGAAATARPPEAVTWQAISSAGHTALWDPQSDTPWYRFRLEGHWHETYFDDPASIALKTALAADLHLQGVGVWSLGMENGDVTMLDALLGGSGPEKLPLTAAAVLSTSRTPGARLAS